MSPRIKVTPKELDAIRAMRKGTLRTGAGYPAVVRDDKKITSEVDPDFAYECLTGIGTWGADRVNPAMAEVYNPPGSKRISKEGAWCMIVRRLPPMEKQMDRKVRVGRCFWIVQQDGTDEFGFSPDGHYKVIATTPWGHVHLWPYEYSVIDPVALFQMWDQKELAFHPAENKNFRWSDAIFYLRSRGIGLVDAIVMALGTVKGPVGWFEPDPALARELEAMEERVNRWKPKSRKSGKPFRIEIKVEGAAKPPPEEGK